MSSFHHHSFPREFFSERNLKETEGQWATETVTDDKIDVVEDSEINI